MPVFSTPIVISYYQFFNRKSKMVLTPLKGVAARSLIDNFYPTAANVVQQSVNDGILIFIQCSF